MPLQAPITIQSSGSSVGATYTLNFTGSGVTSSVTSGIATITIGGGGASSGAAGLVQFSGGSGAFDSASAFSFDKTNDILTVGSAISVGGTGPTTGTIRLPNGATVYGRGPSGENSLVLRYGNGGTYLLEVGEGTNVGEVRITAANVVGGAISGYLGSTNVFNFAGSTLLGTITTPLQLGSGTFSTAGSIRFPYNGGSALQLITARGSGGANENIIQWGPGDSITMGDSSADFKINAFGSNSLATSTGGWTIGVSGNSSAVILGTATNSFAFPLALGTTPSTTGIVRLPSGQAIKSRDAANTADKPLMQFTSNILLIGTDSSYTDQVDRLDIYSSTGGNVYLGNGGNTRLSLNSGGVTLYALNDPLTFGYTGAASQGMIRLPGGSRFQIAGRNNANNGDISIISQNTSDEVFFGTSKLTPIRLRTFVFMLPAEL